MWFFDVWLFFAVFVGAIGFAILFFALIFTSIEGPKRDNREAALIGTWVMCFGLFFPFMMIYLLYRAGKGAVILIKER